VNTTDKASASKWGGEWKGGSGNVNDAKTEKKCGFFYPAEDQSEKKKVLLVD